MELRETLNESEKTESRETFNVNENEIKGTLNGIFDDRERKDLI